VGGADGMVYGIWARDIRDGRMLSAGTQSRGSTIGGGVHTAL